MDEKVGKATTFHLPSTCAPPPPTGSMLDKIKLFWRVIEVICPNIDWGGGGRTNKLFWCKIKRKQQMYVE